MLKSKTVPVLALATVLILCGLCDYSLAADIQDVEGTYTATVQENFKIQGVRPEKGIAPVTITLNGDSSFELISGGSFTGTFELIKKGKKIHFVFDAQSKNLMKQNVGEGAEDIAADEGEDFQYTAVNFAKFKVTDASIDKKTNMPKKFKLQAKGTIQGYLNGEFITAKFSYKGTFVFQSKT